jgi:hypothetical protein
MMLPEGQEPEFTVKQTGDGQYAYVNRGGEQTRITEVHRAFTNDCVERKLITVDQARSG